MPMPQPAMAAAPEPVPAYAEAAMPPPAPMPMPQQPQMPIPQYAMTEEAYYQQQQMMANQYGAAYPAPHMMPQQQQYTGYNQQTLKVQASTSTVPKVLPPDPHRVGRGSNNADGRISSMVQNERKFEEW